jgi:clan AA aspartic protease
MGTIHACVELANAAQPALDPITVEALVDTGASLLSIPKPVAARLALAEAEQREIVLADGSLQMAPYVGPTRVRFENRTCYTGALVLGDETALGALVLEDMDLIVHPRTEMLVVNPGARSVARTIAKQSGRPKSVVAIHATWDNDAQAWVATSEDLPELAVKADTLEILAEKLRTLIPELLEANGQAVTEPVTFRVTAVRDAQPIVSIRSSTIRRPPA